MSKFKQKLSQVSTIITDFDGVLTDGKIYFTDDQQLVRTGNVKDGYAIHLAQKMGLRIIVISGGDAPNMRYRCELLDISHMYFGVENKLEIYERIKKELSLSDDEILYIGDDIPDYQVMQKAALACCPADAAHDIKQIAHYISPYKGGEGCVRDIIEQVLKAKKLWLTPEAFHW